MDESRKDELVARFRAYLDTSYEPDQPVDTVDLYALFTELGGLKNEVGRESRQLKSALDDFRAAFSTLDNANREMADIFQQMQEQEKERTLAVRTPLLLGLIDIYDRLAAGLDQRPPAGRSFWSRFRHDHDERWFAAHLEGQRMVLGRILNLLELCEVTPVETEARAFDPTIMKAVHFEKHPAVANGRVLAESRKGFYRDGRILRPAEVVVNKTVE